MTCQVYLKKNTLSLFYCRVPEVALFKYYTKYVQCTCTLLNSQTFITTWFVLFFRKIDTKLDFSATGIFRLSLSTAGLSVKQEKR